MESYDLVVVGGGSGGIGAAITAGREGLRTLWIEKERLLGGTGTNAWVNVWQPSYTLSRLAPEICDRLVETGGAVFSYPSNETPSGRPIYRQRVDASFEDTRRRWDEFESRTLATAVVYIPERMSRCAREMAEETGKVDVWTESTFLDCRTEPSGDMRRVSSIEVHTPEGLQEVAARHFIDATADLYLADRAGCQWAIGQESADEYEEPSAPPRPQFRLNGWTLCFQVQAGPNLVSGRPGGGPSSDWAHIGQMPDHGFYVNMCFQLQGEVGRRMGREQAREFLLGNIFKRWPAVQRAYGLEDYGISAIAPRTGIREGRRLVGRYVWTENDFMDGNFGKQFDDLIAVGDHALDVHAPGGGCREAVAGPWGVPFRCLQPHEVDNLLVACRGASLSSCGASACRLQTMMMTFGEAAARFIARGDVVTPELPPYEPWQEALKR